MDEFHVYIDEAGDEGFGKLRNPDRGGQSIWLMLGAIIVAKDNDRFLPVWRDEIMDRFQKKRSRDLHFKNLGHDQRVHACRILADKPVGVCVVASDKRTILELSGQKLETYKTKGHLYNWLVRLLLERVTEVCARRAQREACRVHVTFSKRGGTDYESMRDYMYLMRDGREKLRPIRSINWDVLAPEDIRVENHSTRAGLQLADLATSATYKAFEPNLYGDVESRYAQIISPRYIQSSGRKVGCGLTIVPRTSSARENSRELLSLIERKARAPGS